MRVAVIIDDDGNFQVSDLSDREKVHKMLNDELEDYANDIIIGFNVTQLSHWNHYNIIADMYWVSILEEFTQRGTFEIIEI